MAGNRKKGTCGAEEGGGGAWFWVLVVGSPPCRRYWRMGTGGLGGGGDDEVTVRWRGVWLMYMAERNKGVVVGGVHTHEREA